MRAIITFHSLDNSGSVLSYSPKAFARLLAALDSCRIPIVDLDTLLLQKTSSGVALTFDDGIRSVFTEAMPVLRDHGAPAHLFLTTSVVGATNRWPSQPSSAPVFEMLSWQEVETLQSNGMRIEAHTVNHPDLRRLSDTALREECEIADEVIAAKLGVRPRYFAYPYGYHDGRVRAYAGERYQGSLAGELRFLRATEDMTALPRLDAYYLRHEIVSNDLRALHARAFLGFRRILRFVRHGF